MKKIFLMMMVTLIAFTATGCFKRDNMEGIDILATSYPIEFIINELYGDNSDISSVYPDGSNPNTYKFNKKQLNDFAKKDLFIYLGKDKKQSDMAVSIKNINEELLLIDGALGIDVSYDIEEIWLNPADLLMATQNIRKGLNEYVKSTVLNKEIDKEYEELKVKLSALDAEFKTTAENASNKTILVSNDTLSFLSKYGFEVIVYTENNVDEKIKDEVKTLINNGDISYIYGLDTDKENKVVNELLSTNKIKNKFKSLNTISDEDRKNNKDYISLMHENIDELKRETYNQ